MKSRFISLLGISLLGAIITTGCIVVDLNGCGKETVRGSGEVVTEKRQVAEFKTIKLKGSLIDTSKHGLPAALISRRGDGYHLSSLDDSIMVHINGKDIGTENIMLTDGDGIVIGDTQLQFYLQDE